MDKFLRPTEFAELVGVTVDETNRMRLEGRGPRFLKLGTGRTGQIRYRLSDIEAWISSRTFENTTQAAAQAAGAE